MAALLVERAVVGLAMERLGVAGLPVDKAVANGGSGCGWLDDASGQRCDWLAN